jgi:malate dehydrogenase (oxaloacetate-decarboxylating)(NADP+)
MKIIQAASQIVMKDCSPILIGAQMLFKIGFKPGFGLQGGNCRSAHFERIEDYAQTYYLLRQRKGVAIKDAHKIIRDPNVFGLMMVKMGDADACVSGLTYDYPDVIRPALQIHHTHPAARRAAGVYIMIVNNRVLLFTDATVNIDPTAEDLAEISCLAANYARQLGLEPRVALLSFSNFGSTPHPLSNKIRKAVEIIRSKCPDFAVDGEMQADTAVVPEIIDDRYPFSQVRDSNVLVFPSLESANIAYKLLARLGNAQAIGPILLGVGAPVHVLQTGDEVRDIVNMAAIAVMDAMSRDENG